MIWRLILVALALGAVFLTERRLRDGVLAALDRLARKRVFKAIANWPSADVNRTVGDVIAPPKK